MATADELAEWIASLEAALATGALTVTHAGKSVTYRSESALRSILADLRTQQSAAAHVNVTRARFTR